MLILLFSWSILLIFSLLVSQLISSKRDIPLFSRFFLGLAVISVYLHLWAIFLPTQYALIPLILFAVIAIFNKRYRDIFFSVVKENFKALGYKEVVMLIVFLFIGSLPSFINDDAAYYQQTIKWLSEYGYVQGLANLKIHFGLSSSWHLIASSFYFDELPFSRYYNFNGLVLWVLILSLQKQFPKYNPVTLTVLLFFGSLFINAPSPDLIIMCGTVWLLVNLDKINALYFAIIVGFLITVKVTSAGLLIFLLPVLRRYSSNAFGIAGVLLIFGFIFISRNLILSGHPMFPINIIPGFGIHQVPVDRLHSFQLNVMQEIFDVFHLSVTAYYEYLTSYWDRFTALFQVRDYKVIMNILCVMAFVVTPLILVLKKKRNSLLIGFAILLNGFFWFAQAPYYRFALGYVIYMFLIFSDSFIKKSRIHKVTPYFYGLTIVAVLIINLNLNKILYLVECGEEPEYAFKNIIYPVDFREVPYESSAPFKITNCAYCFDTPIPCYSEPVIEHYIINKGHEPALINPNDPGRGFFMKEL